MASLNLNSLSTFWQSVKSYLFSHFSSKPVTLFTSANGDNGTITLSESIDNFEYITIRTSRGESTTIIPSLTATYFTLEEVNMLNPVTMYLQIYAIGNTATVNRCKFTVNRSKYVIINNSNTSATISGGDESTAPIYITRVEGLKRISSS